jgi:hypothetical protein
MLTSLGYFADEEEDRRTLAAMVRALGSAGRLVMELLHRDRIVWMITEEVVDWILQMLRGDADG